MTRRKQLKPRALAKRKLSNYPSDSGITTRTRKNVFHSWTFEWTPWDHAIPNEIQKIDFLLTVAVILRRNKHTKCADKMLWIKVYEIFCGRGRGVTMGEIMKLCAVMCLLNSSVNFTCWPLLHWWIFHNTIPITRIKINF